jgi:hypothetical protein
MPSPRCGYNDKSYYDLRMRKFGVPADDASLPPNYNVYRDDEVSIMDYDAGGKAPWRPNRIGFWGRLADPDNDQPQYLSQFDVDYVVAAHGSTTYYPIITVRLTKDWNGVVYNSNGVGDGYVTNSWPDANSKCRLFQDPADVRELAGLSFKSSASGRVQMYLYLKNSNKDYRISTSTSLSGWTRVRSLGYWMTGSGNVSVKIGIKTRSCSVVPMYEYYKASIDRHIVSPNYMENGWDGWQRTLKGYIIGYSNITE